MSSVRVTQCRLCDSDELSLVVSFTPTPVGDHYVTADRWQEQQPTFPLDVVCCRGCGAVQLADTVDPTFVYAGYLYTTSVSKGLDKHFEQYADDVLERVKPKPGGLVVDIGSNDGTLAMCFKQRGFDVWGVEPAEEIACQSIRRGVQTLTTFFTKEILRWGFHEQSADLITANHIMANVADLHDFTDGIKGLLALHGTFVFETGYWPAIVDSNLVDTIEHEHIHYFAVKPLRQFFRKHGLELVHVEQNHAKGGSLRGFVQHAGATADRSVGDLEHVELVGGYDDLDYLQQWGREQVASLRRLGDLASIAADEGQVWVGYGAAVGSTLLLHQSGLGQHLLCLVDVNPMKQGRLSPGYHVRVVNPSELAKINPDRIVILAWRYAEMIQKQHPEFAGRFILPLPQVVSV